MHHLLQEREIASIFRILTKSERQTWIATHEHRSDKSWLLLPSLNRRGPWSVRFGFHFELTHWHAEIGYRIGFPFWGRSYAMEALTAMIGLGFARL